MRRWLEIKRILHEALELPPAEIDGFLDRSCGRDVELRREIETLIRADAHAGRFISRPILGERAPRTGVTGTVAGGESTGVIAELIRRFEETAGPRRLDDSRFSPGTVLEGRYRIVHLVGRGGMGEVYRADDLKLGQSVALKFLPEPAEGDEDKRCRLIEEVKIARQVAHPNVCRVYDVGEMGSHPFISMELVEGEDLASLLRRIVRPTHEKALEIARQLADGLAAAHDRGVLHCDLKPANLMIDGRGQVRITDFGIARAAGSPSDSGIHGTPAYMAPEQVATREATPETDVYALGLVLYELFTGRRAFEAETAAELVRLHREELPVPPSRLVESIDPEIESLILACLEKDPHDRPASAAEVGAALPSAAAPETVPRKALLVSELVDGRALGGDQARYLDSLHERVLTKLLKEHGGREIERADGTLHLVFDSPIQAVRHALAYQRALENLSEGEGMTLTARVAIHLCEVLEGSAEAGPAPSRPKVMDLDMAERLASLATERQILLTRGAFDLARQSTAAGFHGVRWMSHGSYEMAGLVESLEVCEVGDEGLAPLRAPSDSSRGRRRIVQETISGWRPAPGQDLPHRPNWAVEKRLSEGGFGEVWLAVNRKTRERRVFKFCYEPARLSSLQREITLFRLLKENLGDRDDITRVLDWNFDEAPYFIESEYTPGGSLLDWAESEGGLAEIPLPTRLDVVAQVATALAAAHSVGVLHKDVKPGNVLVTTDGEGRVRARLSDFGVGLVTERQRLVDAGITVLGMTEVSTEDASPGGTRLYMAPELLEGRQATLQADIYALGVVLYQICAGDFSRALAPGWDRDVDDELLEEDIAAAVDGSPEKRLSSASQLAERLRTLELRRKERREECRQEQEAARLIESLAKASRRRKLAAVVIGGLALFGAVVTALLYSVNQEAARANREAESVSEISELLFEVIGTSDPYRPTIDKVSATAILDRGAARMETRLQNQPGLRARMMHSIGVIYKKLGTYDKALELLEEALEIRREIHGGRDIEIVENLDAVAELLAETADLDRAEELIREALEIRDRIESDKPPCVVDCRLRLASILFHKGQLDAAEATYREVLRLRREDSGGDLCSTTMASCLYGLAAVLKAKGDLAGSKEIYKGLLDDQVDSLGRDHPDVARTMNGLALVLTLGDEPDEAEGLYEEALRIRRRALGFNHPDTALTANNYAHLLQKQGKYRAAERFFRESLSMLEQGLGESHTYVAFAKYSLARLFKAKGDLDQARSWLLDSLVTYREVLGADHPEVVSIMNDMKDLLESAD